jgi:hypothetical protein
MREPSVTLVGEIAARLRRMGLTEAAEQASVIAGLAMTLAFPEVVADARAARRTADHVRRELAWETSQMPTLRYALVLYASGLGDGGAFARQTLKTYRDGPPADLGGLRPGASSEP